MTVARRPACLPIFPPETRVSEGYAPVGSYEARMAIEKVRQFWIAQGVKPETAPVRRVGREKPPAILGQCADCGAMTEGRRTRCRSCAARRAIRARWGTG